MKNFYSIERQRIDGGIFIMGIQNTTSLSFIFLNMHYGIRAWLVWFREVKRWWVAGGHVLNQLAMPLLQASNNPRVTKPRLKHSKS
jgi:hypothetical protein